MCINDSTRVDRGFTLIEVLVVVTIIGLLLALTVPAVQSAREASRRAACVNHLKQLGLALSNYEVTHRTYPAGANSAYYSAHLMLLPYLDQVSLYNAANFNVDTPSISFTTDEPNSTVGGTRLAVFCCPSDPNTASHAKTNYAWNDGYGLQLTSYVGSFVCSWPKANRYTTVADITDGLSTTAAMSEWRVGRLDTADDAAVVFSVVPSPTQPYEEYVKQCQRSSRATTKFGSWSKAADWYAGVNSSTLLKFNSTPNRLSCYYDLSVEQGDYPAGSLHTNGVNLLFHDGHVKFFPDSVNLAAWRSLSTKAGNEVVQTDY